MDMEGYKKGLCSLRLEGMNKVYNKKGVEDMTLVRATFSILDFSASGNKQIVPKKVALECMNTLKYKPLVCNYIETTDYDEPNDKFTDHEETEIVLRNGDEYISQNTHAIGVCEDVYMGVIENENNEEVDVILGDFLLWLYRYPNEISLINDFYTNGKTLYTSCEHYYKSNEKDENGNEIINSVLFDGHCVLGDGIEPAYNSSKLVAFNEEWEKAINNKKEELKSLNKKEEFETMEKKNVFFEYFKSNNALAVGSYKWRIFDELEKVMMAEEYNNMWLSEYNIFPTENYFIYDTWTEEGGYKQYKVEFSVDTEDKLTVNYEGKIEVAYQTELVEVKKSLNTKVTELETLTKDLESKDKELQKSLNSNTEITDKLDKANELVISLNAKVEELNKNIEEMQPIVEQYNEAEFEKALNSLKDEYREKFENIGAVDIFNEESTQELIKKSVNATSNEFKGQLNQLIVDNVKVSAKDEKTEEDDVVKSVNSVIKSKETKNLVKDIVDPYEEMCGIKRD